MVTGEWTWTTSTDSSGVCSYTRLLYEVNNDRVGANPELPDIKLRLGKYLGEVSSRVLPWTGTHILPKTLKSTQNCTVHIIYVKKLESYLTYVR
jgi:hypothetical protein